MDRVPDHRVPDRRANAGRSPLKAAPLRVPGQSIDEEMETLLGEKTMPWLSVTLAMLGFTVFEWGRWKYALPYHPIFLSIVTSGMLVWSGVLIVRSRRRLKSLRLARDGERAVGQELEKHRAAGAQVYHDIVGGAFNIDHVLIAREGVFAIETKTWSKPRQREARIQLRDGVLTAAGYVPDRDPIAQAQANARWIAELLESSTGRRFSVRGVVLFPGWFVEDEVTRHAQASGVWVLNARAFAGFIEHETRSVSPADVQLAAFHLARFVRVNSQ